MATVSELFVYERLQLEIAGDTGASKAVMDTHQQVVNARRQQIAALKAEGKNPARINVRAYTFNFDMAD